MKLKAWLKIVIFAVIAALVVGCVAYFLSVPSERDSIGIYGFDKEPEGSIDVVLIGPSEIYTSFYSPLAYEQQGFTSYSLAVSTMTGAEYKSAVKYARRKQDPQLFVVELWGFNYPNQTEESYIRKWIDALEPCSVRSEAIKELVPEEKQESFNFRFLKYHGNWNNISKCAQVLKDKFAIAQRGYSITKNFSTIPYQGHFEKQTLRYMIKEEGMVALKEFLEFCTEEDVNVLFVRTPELHEYVPQDSYYQAIDMIGEYGFPYLNMEEIADEICINDEEDFYNSTHLNIYGCEKYTKFLSEYIMENYDIDTEHSEAVTEEWDICASYNDTVTGRLKDEIARHVDEGPEYLYTQAQLLGQ